jgi:predicted transcriptional regulator
LTRFGVVANFLASREKIRNPCEDTRTMPRPAGADPLSRRERQILDILYRLKRATAAEVRAAIPDPPGDSSIRALLKIMEDKGHVRHEQDGPRYVYLPTVSADRARKSALRQLVRTFFEGSTAQAVAALIDSAESKLSTDDLDQLAARIDQARKEGR